eukprot:scaffold753_cov164-Ochromonas_danica.AAC.19
MDDERSQCPRATQQEANTNNKQSVAGVCHCSKRNKRQQRAQTCCTPSCLHGIGRLGRIFPFGYGGE